MPVRKRKAHTPPPASRLPLAVASPPASTRLEEKLDDLVSLLRCQAVERSSTVPGPAQQQPTPPSMGRFANELNTPSSSAAGAAAVYSDSRYSTTGLARDPEIGIDTACGVVQLLRPGSPGKDVSDSPIFGDMAAHYVPERIAEERLVLFRTTFLAIVPFVHLPHSLNAAELCREKPFLWLNIMALTTKTVSEQFAMEETIWDIISRRIVVHHMVNLDLLLGLIAFCSWSHYFKRDKPFMSTLTPLAVAMAMELGLHHDIAKKPVTRRKQGGVVSRTSPSPRTTEERRTILAVFHLTSACLRILGKGQETPLDRVLSLQVRCQIINNQVTSPADEAEEESSKAPMSGMLISALLGQLADIRDSLPAHIISERVCQFYLAHTELAIRENFLSRRPPTKPTSQESQFQRTKDLESVLTTAERWLGVLGSLPFGDWAGVSVDLFTQMTHTLVVLFKLSTLATTNHESLPGWDTDDVRQRANVLAILDVWIETIQQLPGVLRIIDAEGPRRGLFFKTPTLLKAIRQLFVTELGPMQQQYQQPQGDNPPPPPKMGERAGARLVTQPVVMLSPESAGPQSAFRGATSTEASRSAASTGDFFLSNDGTGAYGNLPQFTGGDDSMIMDDFLFNLAEEPWLADIIGQSWEIEM
ncbi:hypothetical protein B0H63DRAFT_389631 [Podospora didyma]|uniref:Transcription factor n=1 Tax=Podospora didyma TaxID=330526 RepID=A0AAE0P129_9PEZI|nr:hypothetical protein B0H63DRAFT_389631 [Podospora didyma]